MRKCYNCKHYSMLIPVSNGAYDCLYCQKENCIYHSNYGKGCKDYEEGENDGGKTLAEYEEEWELEDE